TCANDTTPCAPTLLTNMTVSAGTNVQSYCAAMLGSSDSVVARAGAACQYGTSDACSYNPTTHSVTCPRATIVLRPTSTPDSGAYQYITQSSQINPPTTLTTTVR